MGLKKWAVQVFRLRLYSKESGRRGLTSLDMAASGFTVCAWLHWDSPYRSEASLPAVSLTYELPSVPVLRHIDCCLDWRRYRTFWGPRRNESVPPQPPKLVQTWPKRTINIAAMARKKSKQQGVVQKELAPGEQTAPKSPVSPGDAAGGGGGDAGLDRLATTRANQVASRKSIAASVWK